MALRNRKGVGPASRIDSPPAFRSRLGPGHSGRKAGRLCLRLAGWTKSRLARRSRFHSPGVLEIRNRAWPAGPDHRFDRFKGEQPGLKSTQSRSGEPLAPVGPAGRAEPRLAVLRRPLPILNRMAGGSNRGGQSAADPRLAAQPRHRGVQAGCQADRGRQ